MEGKNKKSTRRGKTKCSETMESARAVISPCAAEAEWGLKAAAFRMSGVLIGGVGASRGKAGKGGRLEQLVQAAQPSISLMQIKSSEQRKTQ